MSGEPALQSLPLVVDFARGWGWAGQARLGLAVAIAGIAAVTDLRTRRIPNGLNLGGFILAIPLVWWHGGFGWDSGLLSGLAAAAAVFVVFLLAYSVDGVGGGDVKLGGVLGLLVGWPGWLPFLANTAVVGFVWVLVPMTVRFFRGQALRGYTVIYSPAFLGGVLLTWWSLRDAGL